jgi:Protein of unknown function (DUF2786)
MEHESIVRKIQKLFSLAQSSNEAEANLSMATAQSLLAQYNLEAAVVRGTHVAGGTVAPEPEKRERTKIPYSAFYNYQRKLWKTLAEANFCWYWISDTYEAYNKRVSYGVIEQHRKVKRHMLLGTESNVTVVKMMGEYLEDTMERLLPYPNSERLSRSAISWKRGCADRLVERIQTAFYERQKSTMTQAGTGTEIALRDVIQHEYEMNYDAAYGNGAYARKLIDDEQWKAGHEKRKEEAKANEEKAQREWLEYLQNESPVEKRKREKKEEQERIKQEKRQERADRSWSAERRRESKKIDSEAYYSGARVGKEISLDGQLGQGKEQEKLG